MFDPTVFENLKVAIENHLYDLDNVECRILVTNRVNRMEMSVMSREFALQFRLTDQNQVTAEIRLLASIKDLADEILETPNEKPACTLSMRFEMPIKNVDLQCSAIDGVMRKLWNPELKPTQTLSYIYGDAPENQLNTIDLEFNRRISEDQMDDIPELIDYMLLTLTQLNEILI
ncbi:MAG: hypothetical protein H7X86_13140 [Gorillibacterium sp.]|nr:hypothetical protein [Gorillibacterium sp.]